MATLGSISPNFVRQAKRRQRTAFGEKNAIQFHQHTVALNWPQTVHKICAPFAKYVRCSPVAVLHKRLRILKAKKLRSKVGRNVDEIDPGCFYEVISGRKEVILTSNNSYY